MNRESKIFSFYCMLASVSILACSSQSSDTSDKQNGDTPKLIKATKHLHTKCDALSVIPSFRAVFLDTDALLPKYDILLDRAQASNDFKAVFEQINRFISACKECKIQINAHKPAKYSPVKLFYDYKAKLSQLDTAITYAYYFRARKLLEAGELVAALADVIYLRDLRTKVKGVSMALVTDIEMTIRDSIVSACKNDIDRLFALDSPSYDDLEHAYARLMDLLRVQPAYGNCLDDELELMDDILDRAYLIKHQTFVVSDDESTISDFHSSTNSEYISPDESPENDQSSGELQVTKKKYDKRRGKQPEIREEDIPAPEQSASTSYGQSSSMNFSHYAKFENYMKHINGLLKAMRQAVDNKDYKEGIRQCDQIISEMEQVIAAAGSLKLDQFHLENMNGVRNYAQFYKVYSLNGEKRYGDAVRALAVLKQMQTDSGTGTDKKTLSLERTILRNFYREP